jgi:hypothetical protein
VGHPPPLQLSHAPAARAWPWGGSESKVFREGSPLESGQRASCVSQLWQD